MKFRKRPVVVEAEQFLGEPVKGVCEGFEDCSTMGYGSGDYHVHTIHEGQYVYLTKGDWILPEPDGEHFYPVKPDIFEATYEAVSQEETEMDEVREKYFPNRIRTVLPSRPAKPPGYEDRRE